jgi:hypothetical protein
MIRTHTRRQAEPADTAVPLLETRYEPSMGG